MSKKSKTRLLCKENEELKEEVNFLQKELDILRDKEDLFYSQGNRLFIAEKLVDKLHKDKECMFNQICILKKYISPVYFKQVEKELNSLNG